MKNNLLHCVDCKKEIEDGKIYQDRYFFRYHCSWDCLVEYMLDFFSIEKEPKITVVDGVPYDDEDLDEQGNPIAYNI